MQPNEIDLSVDSLNDTIVIVPETYSRFEEFLNRSRYVGENHTLASRDELAMYRTFPKQAGNFKGVSRTSVKFTEDIEVPGVDGTTMLTQPMILEINMTVPVGATAAQTLYSRQRGLALLDQDLIMAPLNDKLMV